MDDWTITWFVRFNILYSEYSRAQMQLPDWRNWLLSKQLNCLKDVTKVIAAFIFGCPFSSPRPMIFCCYQLIKKLNSAPYISTKMFHLCGFLSCQIQSQAWDFRNSPFYGKHKVTKIHRLWSDSVSEIVGRRAWPRTGLDPPMLCLIPSTPEPPQGLARRSLRAQECKECCFETWWEDEAVALLLFSLWAENGWGHWGVGSRHI